jgi:hypothetical protein
MDPATSSNLRNRKKNRLSSKRSKMLFFAETDMVRTDAMCAVKKYMPQRGEIA